MGQNIDNQEKLKVVNYIWHSYIDDEREKRVSNWDDAEHCMICDRKIVHVYELSSGDRIGKQCAFKKLGYTQKQLDSEAWEATREEREFENFYKSCISWSAKQSKKEAIITCLKRNTQQHLIHPDDILGIMNGELDEITFNYEVITKDGLFISFPSSANYYRKLIDKGWNYSERPNR